MAAAIPPASMPSTMRAKSSALGAGEILLTSMDRDGTRQGFDIALTRAVADAVTVPVIASGGVGNLAASGRRHSRRPCQRRAGRVDLSLRRIFGARRQDVYGKRRLAGAARSVSEHGYRRPVCLAQAIALSSRSLPQNISPSGGDESRRAENIQALRFCGLRAELVLDFVRLRRRNAFVRHRLSGPARMARMVSGSIDAPAFGKFARDRRRGRNLSPQDSA